MKTSARIGTGIAAAVLAVGGAVGLAGCATSDSATAAAPSGGQPSAGGVPGGQQLDTSQIAASLATKLGLDEDTVTSALKEVMAAVQPSGQPSGRSTGDPEARPSGQPTGAPDAEGGGSGMIEALAKGLAEKLDLKEATVLAALQEALPSSGSRPTAVATG